MILTTEWPIEEYSCSFFLTHWKIFLLVFFFLSYSSSPCSIFYSLPFLPLLLSYVIQTVYWIFMCSLLIFFLSSDCELWLFFSSIATTGNMVLQAVKKGDTIFIGQYLFTGSETTSVWLEVGQDLCFWLQFLNA